MFKKILVIVISLINIIEKVESNAGFQSSHLFVPSVKYTYATPLQYPSTGNYFPSNTNTLQYPLNSGYYPVVSGSISGQYPGVIFHPIFGPIQGQIPQQPPIASIPTAPQGDIIPLGGVLLDSDTVSVDAAY
ncbi:uncharacterized protein LOC130898482 [Diorhabda carinulata]|uniref:uncharacterized protein LOC130898482 n=1 Tax=Diorhabda carinulata TaxID=1163345 RepID=UPI0025A0A6AF|nr:uncharacterized protein LOC130898482 [Diorhabda carinulata]